MSLGVVLGVSKGVEVHALSQCDRPPVCQCVAVYDSACWQGHGHVRVRKVSAYVLWVRARYT